jgi:hypothetical protein
VSIHLGKSAALLKPFYAFCKIIKWQRHVICIYWGLGVGLNLPCKKIVEKPPKNSAGFCGGGQGLSWAVEPRKEEEG